MSKKIWKGLLITILVLTIIFTAVGILLLVESSKNIPSSSWFDENNEPLTLVQFDNSTLYVVGGLLLSLAFIGIAFLVINLTIRKRLIKDLAEEKAKGKVEINLKKYDFLLAHIFPYSKKEKEILKGICK